MAYDEQLAARVRALMKGRGPLQEKKMFGGLAYMFKGKMCFGIVNDDLVVRVGPDGHDRALKERHTRPMDFTGRPMKGYIYVSPGGVKTAAQLRNWLTRGQRFVSSLPPARERPSADG